MSRSAKVNPRLYEDVVAHPDDDAPRLAYADWCEKNGQADRARFIRGQCRLARLPQDDPARRTLQAEMDPLYYRHGVSWVGREFCGSGVTWQFARGFPECVSFGGVTALESMQATMFRHPVRRIGFYALRSVSRLASCPALARIRELQLTSGCNLSEEGLRVLVGSSHIGSLTWLKLAHNRIGPGGARLLAGWPALAPLRYLELNSTDVGDEGLIALAGSPHFRQLTRIDLRHNKIGPAGFRAFAETGCWPRLQVLQLANNNAGDEDARQLSRARQWTALMELNLSYNRIGDEGMIALAGARHLAGLRFLHLGGNGIGDAGAIALAGAGHLGQLRSLSLFSNLIGDEGALALGRSPHFAELRELHLFGIAARPEVGEAVQNRYRVQEPGLLDNVGKPAAAMTAAPAEPPPLQTGVGPADENGLLRAIIDDPDDDVPRRIFADWLEENGEPQRGELIRLQCDPSSWQQTHGRRQALTRAIFARFPGVMQEQVQVGRCWFDRGLLTVVTNMRTFQSRVFQEQAPTWARQQRVHGLMLLGTTKHWKKVADAAVLEAFHELDLRSNDLQDAGLGALLGSPHLAGLHTLRLFNNRVRHGLVTLARSTTLPRLRRLELPNNHVSLESLHALAGWPAAQRLTTLDLQCNHLNAAEVSVLCNSPHLTGLVRLNLQYCGIGDNGARVLAGSPHLDGLRHLELTHTGIGDSGARLLAESPYLRRLQTLNLGNNLITDEGAEVLASSPMMSEMQRLVLASSKVSEGALARLRQRLGERLVVNH
jgi:uncharacterized protein (TIGR02996 family)